MEYLVKTGKRLCLAPLVFWLGLPKLKGKKVLVILGLIFLLLLGIGVYNTVQGGFKRWDDFKAKPDPGLYQFVPPATIWGTQAVTALKNQQLRQLQLSCTCTGGAYRGI